MRRTRARPRPHRGPAVAASAGSNAPCVPHAVEQLPRTAALADLKPLLPVFLSYILSFLYVGMYWNNHHHLFHATKHVTGGILWANLHLLF